VWRRRTDARARSVDGAREHRISFTAGNQCVCDHADSQVQYSSVYSVSLSVCVLPGWALLVFMM